MRVLETLPQFLTVLCCGLFAGAAGYITAVEHPARLECGTAVTEFRPSYRRATIMQVLLASVGFASSIVVWFAEHGWAWLFGGLLFVTVVPFTLLVVLPTNKLLLDPSLDKSSQHARDLLVRWGRFHALRSLLSASAFVLFLYLLVR